MQRMIQMMMIILSLWFLALAGCSNESLEEYQRMTIQNNEILQKLDNLEKFEYLPTTREELAQFKEVRDKERQIWNEALTLVSNTTVESRELWEIHQKLVRYYTKSIEALDTFLNNLTLENMAQKNKEYYETQKEIDKIYQEYIDEFKQYCRDLGYTEFE
jgi:hypothetical protein